MGSNMLNDFYYKLTDEEKKTFYMVWNVLSVLSFEENEYVGYMTKFNNEKEKMKFSLNCLVIIEEYWGYWCGSFPTNELDEYLNKQRKLLKDNISDLFIQIVKRKVNTFNDLIKHKKWKEIHDITKKTLNDIKLGSRDPEFKVNWDEWVDWYEYNSIREQLGF